MDSPKKRNFADFEADEENPGITGLGATLALLKTPDLPTFNVANGHTKKRPSGEDQWTIVQPSKKKKAKKIPKPESSNYPVIAYSPSSNLQFQIQIQHLQELVLYLLADGKSPQWISVQNKSAIRKVVVLMAPGLERDMFTGDILQNSVTKDHHIDKHQAAEGNEDANSNRKKMYMDAQTYKTSPEFYLPSEISEDSLPESLKPLARIFKYVWPVRTPGDDRHHKMHSPIQRMLSSPLTKNKSLSTSDSDTLHLSVELQSQRVPVTKLLCSLETLQEFEFVPHPAMFDSEQSRLQEADHRQRQRQDEKNGWMDTNVNDMTEGEVEESKIEQGSTTAGREVIAVDCEMCKIEDGELGLTRISLVDWDGQVILDELVKPDQTIVDYLTP